MIGVAVVISFIHFNLLIIALNLIMKINMETHRLVNRIAVNRHSKAEDTAYYYNYDSVWLDYKKTNPDVAKRRDCLEA